MKSIDLTEDFRRLGWNITPQGYARLPFADVDFGGGPDWACCLEYHPISERIDIQFTDRDNLPRYWVVVCCPRNADDILQVMKTFRKEPKVVNA